MVLLVKVGTEDSARRLIRQFKVSHHCSPVPLLVNPNGIYELWGKVLRAHTARYLRRRMPLREKKARTTGCCLA